MVTLIATNYKTANQYKFQRNDGIGAMEGTYSKVPIIRTDPILRTVETFLFIW